jgi:hypothetical protein
MTLSSDTIIREIHQFREQHAASLDHDVMAIVRDLIRQQNEAKMMGKQFVDSPAKRCNDNFPYTPIDMPVAGTSTMSVE